MILHVVKQSIYLILIFSLKVYKNIELNVRMETENLTLNCFYCNKSFNNKDSIYTFDCGHKLHSLCFNNKIGYVYDIESNKIICPICVRDEQRNLLPRQILRKRNIFQQIFFLFTTCFRLPFD